MADQKDDCSRGEQPTTTTTVQRRRLKPELQQSVTAATCRARRTARRARKIELFDEPCEIGCQIIIAGDEPFQFCASAVDVGGIDELRDEPLADLCRFAPSRPQSQGLPIRLCRAAG